MEKGLDIEKVHAIMKEIIGAIDNSKGQLIDIVENAREEHELLKNELNYIKEQIEHVINEVDRLTIKDKMVRNKLAEVSKALNNIMKKILRRHIILLRKLK